MMNQTKNFPDYFRMNWRSLRPEILRYWVHAWTNSLKHPEGHYVVESTPGFYALFNVSRSAISRWGDRLYKSGAMTWVRKQKAGQVRNRDAYGCQLPNVMKPAMPPPEVFEIVREFFGESTCSTACNVQFDSLHADQVVENALSPENDCIRDRPAHGTLHSCIARSKECAVDCGDGYLDSLRAVSVNADECIDLHAVLHAADRVQIESQLADKRSKLKHYEEDLGTPRPDLREEITKLEKELAGAR